jgi:hypothetical protein
MGSQLWFTLSTNLLSRTPLRSFNAYCDLILVAHHVVQVRARTSGSGKAPKVNSEVLQQVCNFL